jgi:hypothetical protein
MKIKNEVNIVEKHLHCPVKVGGTPANVPFQLSFIQFQISKQSLQMENIISENEQPRENVHVMMN